MPQTYTDRSNARRRALKMIAAGSAPARFFDIAPCDGGFQIAWQAESATTALIETEIAAATEAADQPAAVPAPSDERTALITQKRVADAIIAVVNDNPGAIGERLYAGVAEHISADDFAELMRLLVEAERLSQHGELYYPAAAPAPAPAKRARKDGKAQGRKGGKAEFEAEGARLRGKPAGAPEVKPGGRWGVRSKYAAAPETIAAGILPPKPIINSPSNPSYQKKVDRLAGLAEAGDWAGVESFALGGSNATYPRIVRRYRDQLLAAHAAQAAA